MNSVSTLLEFLVVILGWIITIALFSTAMGWGIYLIIQSYKKAVNIRYEDAKRAAMQDICNRMMSDSWWFSEDPATMNLLQRIATDVNDAGWSEINSRREEWRKERQNIGTCIMPDCDFPIYHEGTCKMHTRQTQ